MIELLLASIIIGLYILYRFGIKPELDNWNHEQDCKDHYK